ncbi:hypothetical protein [Marinactinospora rubrisoli]|uniref:Aminoglycoside phosphotransferase domain-containing protein n=1 Tax=Marinactinospora rubrisoli TaxID=2715399 RepID=A0ABW2KKH3_9ACTN
MRDDGDWVALVFEEVPGRLPAQPWRGTEQDAILTAISDLAEALTPSPVDGGLLRGPRLGGWPKFADAPGAAGLAALSSWAEDHIGLLVALEENAVLAGDTLLHGDLYPFNVLVTADRAYVGDWPHAWVGRTHCAAVTLISGASLGGVDPRAIADGHPLTRDLDPGRINEMPSLHAGFLLRAATSAGPAAGRRLAHAMAALARVSLRWLCTRL